MALSFVLSWYPKVDLAQLATRRARAEENLAQLSVTLAARTSDIASYTPFDEFIRERATDGAGIPEDTYGLAFNDSEGSAGETADEETGSSTGAYAETTPGAEADTGVMTSAATELVQPGADAPVA